MALYIKYKKFIIYNWTFVFLTPLQEGTSIILSYDQYGPPHNFLGKS